MKYRVFDKVENCYPENQYDYYLTSRGKLLYNNAPSYSIGCESYYLIEVDQNRYVVEMGTGIKDIHEGKSKCKCPPLENGTLPLTKEELKRFNNIVGLMILLTILNFLMI